MSDWVVRASIMFALGFVIVVAYLSWKDKHIELAAEQARNSKADLRANDLSVTVSATGTRIELGLGLL